MLDKLLSIQEACHLLGCSRTHLYRLLNSHALDYVQIGICKGKKIPLSSIQEMIEQRKVPAYKPAIEELTPV